MKIISMRTSHITHALIERGLILRTACGLKVIAYRTMTLDDVPSCYNCLRSSEYRYRKEYGHD